MATKDERPGLLSKVAMFVRNPTKDWSELDQPEEKADAAYDKAALKAMIERKRQNDFIRKREFDQLRKLRNRDPAAIASMAARPSFFQTSVPMDQYGRADTLKKIDEIEAQMSKQWWKGRADGAPTPTDANPPAVEPQGAAVPEEPDAASALPPHMQFAPTEPLVGNADGNGPDSSEFAPTVMASGLMALGAKPVTASAAEGLGMEELDFSAQPAADAQAELGSDPELEEAAIRYANGDDAGSEQGLLEALRGNDLEPEAARFWATALLDLYRATAQQEAFVQATQEFSVHLSGLRPAWQALAEAPLLPVQAEARPAHAGGAWIWECGQELSLSAMDTLRHALSTQAMPWRLNWSAVTRIAPDAVNALDSLVASLCNEEVGVVFTGGDRLLFALRALTPSGDRRIPSQWWHLRLNALRIMGLQDDFELAALDYCVTYEVAPPVWSPARCRLEAEPAVLDDAVAARMRERAQQLSGEQAPLQLQGQILGDAGDALETLNAQAVPGKRMVVHCERLLRVDFAAAGSLLNWVAQQQASGRLIHFVGVNRMVAAFFNVVGINEHAKVTPRPL